MTEQYKNEESTCACGGTCGCGGHHQADMVPKEEYVARLEQYLVDLKTEIVAVEAELAELRETA